MLKTAINVQISRWEEIYGKKKVKILSVAVLKASFKEPMKRQVSRWWF